MHEFYCNEACQAARDLNQSEQYAHELEEVMREYTHSSRRARRGGGTAQRVTCDLFDDESGFNTYYRAPRSNVP